MKHARKSPLLKRLVTAVTAIAAVIALTAGGTLAYFSASERAHNVITSGGVDIELVEKTYDESGKLVDFPEGGLSGIVPGSVVDKIVTVENSGASDAWVRIAVDRAFVNEDGASLHDVMTLDTPSGEGAAWQLVEDEDGSEWWYYVKPLKAGESTSPLFNTVTFHKSAMDNAYQNGTAEINVSAQAVQYANNGDGPGETVFDANGWPEA